MSVIPDFKYCCRRCGARMVDEYRPAGFDDFYGWRVYQRRRRCPRGWWGLAGLFSRHSETAWTRPDTAHYFGLDDHAEQPTPLDLEGQS
jgi:hypothetical protein